MQSDYITLHKIIKVAYRNNFKVYHVRKKLPDNVRIRLPKKMCF